MNGPTRISHPLHSLLPTDIEGFDSLAELALDMRWSWNHATDHVWRQLDPALWALTQNPWVVLQTVSRDHLERVLADPGFRTNVENLLRAKRQAAERPTWFRQQHPHAVLTCVAYFSMEFMLSEALPIYAGGLGNVAGDQLKAASDLGVPVIGVGLLYQQGYFRQLIDHDGAQQAIAIGRHIIDWRHSLDPTWPTLRFGDVNVETRGEQHVFDVQVYLSDLDPDAVRVELYADGVMGVAPVRQAMTRVGGDGASGSYVYGAAVSAARPPGDYTARVIPHHDGVAIPLEDTRILWQR